VVLMGALISLAILLLFSVAYCLWRYQVHKQAGARYGPSLPPSNRLSWRVPTSRSRPTEPAGATPAKNAAKSSAPSDLPSRPQHAKPDVVRAGFAASSDGALVGLSALQAFNHIDPAVLNALQFSTAEHLHGLHSIDAYVRDHFFNASTQSAEGWLHRLEGYVAEQKAAATLEKAGHVVRFAHMANQPGWDFLVDGHPLQVKEGVTLTGVKDALAHHPHIPIATGSDLAAAAKNSMVHGYHALDHLAVAAQTKETLAGVKDGFHPGLKIPVVTIALSSWREFRLLMNAKTTWDRALKSVAIDTAGVGIGMTGGAKLGGLIGSVAGPVGAGLLAFVGAIGGAIAGRWIAHDVRFKDFDRAYEHYQEIYHWSQMKVNQKIDWSRKEVQRLQQSFQQRFLSERNRIEESAQIELKELHAAYEKKVSVFTIEFPRYLQLLIEQLRREELDVLRAKPRSPWWRFIFPGPVELERFAVHSWFESATRIVKAEQKNFRTLPDATPNEVMVEIKRFLADYEFELVSLEEHLKRLRSERDKACAQGERTQDRAILRVLAVRDELIREFRDRVAVLHSEVAGVIQQWCENLRQAQERVRCEGRPLGVELPS
jgi:hypothetical protein